MSKLKLFVALSLAFVWMIVSSSAQNANSSAQAELPDEIKTFINTHFPDHQVTHFALDQDGGNKEYDVTLSDNIRLEFDDHFMLKEGESKVQLPDAIIPETILAYVKENYPNSQIVNWDRDKDNQSVELSDGVELDFDLEGNFLKMDN